MAGPSASATKERGWTYNDEVCGWPVGEGSPLAGRDP